MYAKIAVHAILLNLILSTIQSYIITKSEQNQIITDFLNNSNIILISFFMIMVVFVVPVIEELIFRGALWKLVTYLFSEKIAFYSIAILFAFVHSLESAIFLLPVAFYLSYLRQTTKMLHPGMFFHVVFNSTGVLVPFILSKVVG